MDTVIVSGRAATPNSSMALVTLAPVALVAVPFYWDNFGMYTLLAHSLSSLVEATITLALQNPAETLLSAIVSAWALSSATMLARSPLRRLRRRAKGIYQLASTVLKLHLGTKVMPPRRASRTSLLLPRLSDAVRKQWDGLNPEARRTGLSVQLTPGPRIVLEWVTEETACRTSTSRSPGTRKLSTLASQPSPARKLLTAHALLDDEMAESVLQQQSYSFDWGMFNMASYIYWPELGWSSSRGGRAAPTSCSDEVDTFKEFKRTLECDLKRQSRVGLCHSQSLPTMSTVRARQCVSFDCSMDITEDEEVEREIWGTQEDENSVEAGGVLEALQASRGLLVQLLALFVFLPKLAIAMAVCGKLDYLPSPGDWACLLTLWWPTLTVGACLCPLLQVGVDLLRTVPDSFILQFAALLGEQKAAERLQQDGLPAGCTCTEALFGKADEGEGGALQGWDKIVEESLPGKLSYRAFKRPLRRGINMYMTTTVTEDASPREMQRFILDDTNRLKWDDNCLEHTQVKHLEGAAASSHRHDSCFLYSRTKFPRPMAAREYVYARRVVESGSGCYIVQAVPQDILCPPLPESYGRSVRISDYTSCTRIRAVPSQCGRAEGAVEMSLVYFEDSQVRPGLMNLAVAKGLWPFVQRQDAFFRCYQATLRRRSLDVSKQHHAYRPPAESAAPMSTKAQVQANPFTMPGPGWQGAHQAACRATVTSPSLSSVQCCLSLAAAGLAGGAAYLLLLFLEGR
eukprot:CAMPEP_0117678346 /NCGR_PEP_ID=MMETSP0804-20121206/17246_1 /TAXON_ID=1074897 /ORGANISM="Tetraselmis astigmatica, Strain CCMP880" /LENGTH=742 /DNA_ID=CAMNT_0005487723 /DNA_START=550 /DNA_END=2779 /DNA_ORIENTATION=-